MGPDAVFLGDGPALGPDVATAPGGGLDPLVLLGNLTAVTERLSAVITSSSTYNSPYNLARRFQSRLVVPLLVERGLFRPAEVGVTLRERLGLPFPVHAHVPAHAHDNQHRVG